MDDKRLQEIKKESKRLRKLWELAKEHEYRLAEDIHTVANFVDEIVAALEWWENSCHKTYIKMLENDNADLRKQLAEALVNNESAKENDK